MENIHVWYYLIFSDLAQRHELKTMLSHEAVQKAVNNFWKKGIFSKQWTSFKFLQQINAPKTIFILNIASDLLFFILLSLMMLTGMCRKARASQIRVWSICFLTIERIPPSYAN